MMSEGQGIGERHMSFASQVEEACDEILKRLVVAFIDQQEGGSMKEGASREESTQRQHLYAAKFTEVRQVWYSQGVSFPTMSSVGQPPDERVANADALNLEGADTHSLAQLFVTAQSGYEQLLVMHEQHIASLRASFSQSDEGRISVESHHADRIVLDAQSADADRNEKTEAIRAQLGKLSRSMLGGG